MITVEYDEIITETGKAVLFDIEGEEIWIPASQLEDYDEDNQTFDIPDWLAEEKGLV